MIVFLATIFNEKNKKEENMELRKYIKKNGMTIEGFARLTGIPLQTVYNIISGTPPRIQTGVCIEEFTKGKVRCKDLVPKRLLKKKTTPKSYQKSCNEKHEQDKNENHDQTTQ